MFDAIRPKTPVKVADFCKEMKLAWGGSVTNVPTPSSLFLSSPSAPFFLLLPHQVPCLPTGVSFHAPSPATCLLLHPLRPLLANIQIHRFGISGVQSIAVHQCAVFSVCVVCSIQCVVCSIQCVVCSIYCASTAVCSGCSPLGVLLAGGDCGDYEQQPENPQEEDTGH